ncbi:hypothetical protein [Noviherbaspirillum aerium]|uniref:hypothetical protein n=1 Tax=Noviherbaspirillum aerium TaxID=2588497 RepID=UPI00178C4F4B|nr:hypothetical protein [Noviherbaspirillum aerium]
MNWFQCPRFSKPSSSISLPGIEEKKPSAPAPEPQAASYGSTTAPTQARLRNAGNGMASRLHGMLKQSPKEDPVANANAHKDMKAPLHEKVRINSLPSERQIYADDITQLSSAEITAMTSALNIPWTQDLHRLEKSIAGRLDQMFELVNCVLNQSTSPHGFVPQQEVRMAVIKDENLDHPAFQRNLGMSPEQASMLKKAKKHANMDIVMVSGHERPTLALYFDSSRAASGWKERTQALAFRGRIGRDTREIMNSVLRARGDTFAEVKEAAAVLADLSEKGTLNVDMVAGHSLGGAYAQYFKAAYESRGGSGQHKPAMVLLDPVLLNNKQAADAIRGAPHGYDYRAPRGIAITLDNVKAPAKSLLSHLKGMGFKHPGLVHLKLDVKPGDAATFQWAKDAQGNSMLLGDEPVPMRQRDNPRPGMLMGYHIDTSVYEMAIHRFTSKTK